MANGKWKMANGKWKIKFKMLGIASRKGALIFWRSLAAVIP
jgi:hypothetical protein